MYTIKSTHGEVTVDKDGFPLTIGASLEDLITGELYLYRINEFDIDEYKAWAESVGFIVDSKHTIDILHIGYTTKDGIYTPADQTARELAVEHRTQL